MAYYHKLRVFCFDSEICVICVTNCQIALNFVYFQYSRQNREGGAFPWYKITQKQGGGEFASLNGLI